MSKIEVVRTTDDEHLKACMRAVNESSRSHLLRELGDLQEELAVNERRRSWLGRHMTAQRELLAKERRERLAWMCIAIIGWAIVAGTCIGTFL